MAIHYDRHENVPIIMKANEITSLTDAIVQSLDVDSFIKDMDRQPSGEILEQTSEYLKFLKTEMLSNAYTLSAKLHAAYAIDLYTQKMENATLIKLAARTLLTQTSALSLHKYKHYEYLLLLRSAIEEFRLLFVEWLSTFDKLRDIPDGWGMFYDPEHAYELPEWEDDADAEAEDDDDFWTDDEEEDDE